MRYKKMKDMNTIINEIKTAKTADVEQLETLGKIFAFNALNRCINPTRRADIAISKGSKKYYSVYHLNKDGKMEYYGETVDCNGYSSFAVNARRDIMSDSESVENMRLWNDCTKRYYLGQNGDGKDMYIFERSEYYENAINEYVAGYNLGDGYDFINQAVMLILEYLAETDYDLTADIKWTKADKHIVFDIDYKTEIKTEMIPAVVAIFRKMEKYINDQRASRYDETSKYSYVQIDEVNDIYFRTGKYADIGGYEQTINGDTWYTTELGSVKRFERQKKELYAVLSKGQKEILNMRLKGYSVKHIAEIRGCARNPVYNQLKRIAEKAEKLGIVNE